MGIKEFVEARSRKNPDQLRTELFDQVWRAASDAIDKTSDEGGVVEGLQVDDQVTRTPFTRIDQGYLVNLALRRYEGRSITEGYTLFVRTNEDDRMVEPYARIGYGNRTIQYADPEDDGSKLLEADAEVLDIIAQIGDDMARRLEASRVASGVV